MPNLASISTSRRQPWTVRLCEWGISVFDSISNRLQARLDKEYGLAQPPRHPPTLLNCQAIDAFCDEAISFQRECDAALERRRLLNSWAEEARNESNAVYRDIPLLPDAPAQGVTKYSALKGEERGAVDLLGEIAHTHEQVGFLELNSSFWELSVRLEQVAKSLARKVEEANLAHGVDGHRNPMAEFDNQAVSRLAIIRKHMTDLEGGKSYEHLLREAHDELSELVMGYRTEELRIKEEEKPSAVPRLGSGAEAVVAERVPAGRATNAKAEPTRVPSVRRR
jgi:hypothetical protein